MYIDVEAGGSRDHELSNNPGQNPVVYEACSRNTRSFPDLVHELGFSTMYLNLRGNERATQGLTDGGDVIGVIGDVLTEMQSQRDGPQGRGGYGGGEAPHGNQYCECATRVSTCRSVNTIVLIALAAFRPLTKLRVDCDHRRYGI